MTQNGKRILIVDDDPDYNTATSAVLTSAGYAVGQCVDAESAMGTIRKFKPDLIILDVMMETGTAGFEVSYQIRKDPDFTAVPILMVTAIHQATTVRFSPETDGEYLPVQEILDKPVPPDVLLGKVEQLLNHGGR